jgi:hypothetical protein
MQTDENTWLKSRLRSVEWEALSKTREAAMLKEQLSDLSIAMRAKDDELQVLIKVMPR